jgi:hypothetical protein
VALAGRWFAPHYAVPERWICTADSVLRSAAAEGAEQLAELKAGDGFEVLEVSGGWAWGYRTADPLVGYVAAARLRPAGARA